MKTLLLRLMLAAVVVAGLITVVVVTRLVLVSAPAAPERTLHPFTFDEDGASERIAAARRLPMPSRSSPAGLGAEDPLDLHRYLEEAFPRVHDGLERETVSGRSLLYRWEGSRSGLSPILLSVSMEDHWFGEVIPGDPVAGSPLRGPGVKGTLGPLLAIFEAVEALLSEGVTPERTILLALTHDGANGAGSAAREIARFLDERGVHPEWALTGGGFLSTGIAPGIAGPVALVGTAEKGSLVVELRASTSEARASSPPSPTANSVVSDAMGRLQNEPFPVRLERPFSDQTRILAPHMDPAFRMLARNLWIFRRPYLWVLSADPNTASQIRTTMVPTQISGGSGAGEAPDPAPGRILVRIAPWDSVEGVVAGIRDRLADLEVDVSVVGSGTEPTAPAAVASPESRPFQLLREAVHGAFPDVVTVAPFLSISAHDGQAYEGVAGEVLRFSPYRADPEILETLGTAEESLPLREYHGLIRFYGELIRRGALE